MSGLLELGPMTAEVVVMGKTLTLNPLSVDDIIALFGKFPELVKLMQGTGDRAEAIKNIGSVAIGTVIACSTGELDNPEAIATARKISLGKSVEIIDKIIGITFEDGTGPFVERLNKMTGIILSSGVSGTQSSEQWSASLVGDEPRKPRVKQARAS
jgi:hypothetical protein